MTLLLASASQARMQLLTAAGLSVTAHPARIDEAAVRASLQADAASARDIADALAEMKARKVAERHPADMVIGCDQVLALGSDIFAKPGSVTEARDQLLALRGQTHHLYSAVVIYDAARPVWRHVGVAALTMRPISDTYLDAYLARNWPSVQSSVGAYMLEHEGVRLFSAITGDYFTILGLPLLPLLDYLGQRGIIAT